MDCDLSIPEPAAYWSEIGPSDRSGPSGLWARCLNRSGETPSVAMREIAGLAAYRKWSQEKLAISYSAVTGRTVTAANVIGHFRSPRPHRKTVETYAAIVRMSQDHLNLVSSPWPILEWPSSRSIISPEAWLDDHLHLDRMSPLFKSGQPPHDVRSLLLEPARRDFTTVIIHRVILHRERELAARYASFDRKALWGNSGVALETWLRFEALRIELKEIYDFEPELVQRRRGEEYVERTLLDLFNALSGLCEPMAFPEDVVGSDADFYAKMKSKPTLEYADVDAVLSITERLLAARGFDATAIRNRLEDDYYYGNWISERLDRGA